MMWNQHVVSIKTPLIDRTLIEAKIKRGEGSPLYGPSRGVNEMLISRTLQEGREIKVMVTIPIMGLSLSSGRPLVHIDFTKMWRRKKSTDL